MKPPRSPLLLGLLLLSTCAPSYVSFPVGPEPDEIAPFFKNKSDVLLPPLVEEKNGSYFIADRMRSRIMTFTRDGRFIRAASLVRDGQPVVPDLFVVAAEGTIYTAVYDPDSDTADLLKFAPDGSFLLNLERIEGRPQDMAIDDEGDLGLVLSRADESWSTIRFVDDVAVDRAVFSNDGIGPAPQLVLPFQDGASFLIEWRDPADRQNPSCARRDTRTGRILPVARFPLGPDAFLYSVVQEDRPVFLEFPNPRKARISVFDPGGRNPAVSIRKIRTRTSRGILLDPFLPVHDRLAELRFTRSAVSIVFP